LFLLAFAAAAELRATNDRLLAENARLQAAQARVSSLYESYQADKAIFAEALERKDADAKLLDDKCREARAMVERYALQS
jgi:hypothetical protein